MDMYKKLIRLVAALVFCGLSSSIAQAVSIEPIIDGGAVVTNSWQINTGFSASSYDTFEAFIQDDTGAGPFELPGIDNFSTGGWSAQLINPGYVLGTGPTTFGSLNFDMHFAGDITQSVNVDIFVYTAGNILGYGQWRFSNGSVDPIAYGVNDPTGKNYDRTAVPEPATLALMGLGMAGLGFIRRKQA